MNKVYVEVKIKLVVEQDNDVDVSDIISEMDYDFTSQTSGAEIVDTEIIEFDVTDNE